MRKVLALAFSIVLLGAGCSSSLVGFDPLTVPVSGQAEPGREDDIVDPLDRVRERELKLTFGLYVTPNPDQNPIDPPERFTGYHTALDFEILEGEEKSDVYVYAICAGQVLLNKYVDGYGGTLVQSCIIDGEPVTVLYGHLDPASTAAKIGDHLSPGDALGFLGEAYTEETSQNRKHLHLGIHQGERVVLQGYAASKSELDAFLDPAKVLGYPESFK